VKHSTANVSPDAQIPESASIWHYAQVREQLVISEKCVVGGGAHMGNGVQIDDSCKAQKFYCGMRNEGPFNTFGPAESEIH
jgi:UDP-2-acetamido-3-amino-2,3-dideoxy-glucuronate N-acetyltransferase